MAGKNPNGEGSIFRSGTKWKAVVTVGWTRDGKRRRRTRTAKSRADAAAFLREMLTEIATGIGTMSIDGRQTTGDFLTAWLRDAVKPLRSENTYASYSHAVDRFIRPHIGRVPLAKLTPQHIQTMLAGWRESKVGGRSQRLAYGTLNTAMNYAQRMQVVKSNPCEPIEKPRNTRKKIRPFTHAEARSILAAVKDTRWEAPLALAVTTGLRLAELFGLKWERVDLQTRTVEIVEQAIDVAGRVIVRVPKTAGSIRTLEISPATAEALQRHRAILLKEGNAGSSLVCPAPRGGHLRRSTFSARFWRPLLKKLNIEHRGFHHLRHTYATLALGAGVPVHVVSKVLGHGRSSTTLDVYAHTLEQQQAAATHTMQQLFG